MKHLTVLCEEIGSRHPGSEANQKATDYFFNEMENFSCEVERQPFDCLDWADNGSSLQVNGDHFDVLTSPYTHSCDITAEMVMVTSLEQLQSTQFGGKVLVIHGELAKEQI
ncbi:Zn-dependent exopeptidase M28, partial [Candidatus Neomarinimicrobiota bacterium]